MQLQHVVRRANRANLIRAHNPNPTRNSPMARAREPTLPVHTYMYLSSSEVLLGRVPVTPKCSRFSRLRSSPHW